MQSLTTWHGRTMIITQAWTRRPSNNSVRIPNSLWRNASSTSTEFRRGASYVFINKWSIAFFSGKNVLYDSMTIICNRLHDTVLDSDRSLTLPVLFTSDDIVDLFSRVYIWFDCILVACAAFSFFFSFSVSVYLSVYLVLRVRFNNN